MAFPSRIDPACLVGRAPESLNLAERAALSGKLIALELYTPATTPLRRIQAIGDTVADCVHQCAARGLDPRAFEYTSVSPR